MVVTSPNPPANPNLVCNGRALEPCWASSARAIDDAAATEHRSAREAGHRATRESPFFCRPTAEARHRATTEAGHRATVGGDAPRVSAAAFDAELRGATDVRRGEFSPRAREAAADSRHGARVARLRVRSVDGDAAARRRRLRFVDVVLVVRVLARALRRPPPLARRGGSATTVIAPARMGRACGGVGREDYRHPAPYDASALGRLAGRRARDRGHARGHAAAARAGRAAVRPVRSSRARGEDARAVRGR